MSFRTDLLSNGMNSVLRMTEQDENAFASPEATDHVDRLVAADPHGFQRAGTLGLLLWGGWIMAVLVLIVWLVG